MSSKPAISVIIPCYNAQPHIARALKSLLAQSFTDWEAIIVSDDGVDYSKIVADAEISDNRLRFHSTEATGTGPGNARNKATLKANSDILANLDADDEFAPDYLEVLYPLAQKHGLVVSNYRYIDDATKIEIPKPISLIPQSGEIGLQNLCRLLFNYTHVSFIYDRQRVKSEWITGLPVSEDTVFLMKAYDYLQSIYAYDAPLYHYYRRSGSLTNHSRTSDWFIAAKRSILERIRTQNNLFRNPCVGLIAEYYFQNSVEAEIDYAKALENNEKADFLMFFERKLRLHD